MCHVGPCEAPATYRYCNCYCYDLSCSCCSYCYCRCYYNYYYCSCSAATAAATVASYCSTTFRVVYAHCLLQRALQIGRLEEAALMAQCSLRNSLHGRDEIARTPGKHGLGLGSLILLSNSSSSGSSGSSSSKQQWQ